MKYFLIILISALASLIQLPVEASDFRVSAGIIVLMTAICHYQVKRPIRLGLLTGLAVCFFRMGVDSILIHGLTGAQSLSYLLETFFYLGYVFLFTYTANHPDPVYPLPLVVCLGISDFGGNFLEYISRLIAGLEGWSNVSLKTLLLAAFVRSVLITICLYLWNRMSGKSVNPLYEPAVPSPAAAPASQASHKKEA